MTEIKVFIQNLLTAALRVAIWLVMAVVALGLLAVALVSLASLVPLQNAAKDARRERAEAERQRERAQALLREAFEGWLPHALLCGPRSSSATAAAPPT